MNTLRRIPESTLFTAIIVSFALAALLIAITGEDPVNAFGEIVRGATTKSGPANTMNRLIPIVGSGLALSIPFRAGIINLGGEGQMVTGGLAGTLVAINVDGPGILVIPLAFIVSALVGALWALIPALGQTRLGLPILISSLLLSFPARALTGYLVRFHFADPAATGSSTYSVPKSARVPDLGVTDMFGKSSLTLLFLVLLVILISIINNRTVAGYRAQTMGLNQDFARYGGVSIQTQTLVAMTSSGAILGMMGTHLVLAESYRFVDGDLVASGFVWSGLLVTLLALHRPIPILVAGTLFAGLQVGALAMQRNSDVSWQLAQVLQAVLILSVGCHLAFRRPRPRLETADA